MLCFLFVSSLIWNLLLNFRPVYVICIFTLSGNTFLSVLFRFSTTVALLEQVQGNSEFSKWTSCSCEFGCSVILIWETKCSFGWLPFVFDFFILLLWIAIVFLQTKYNHFSLKILILSMLIFYVVILHLNRIKRFC